MINSKTRSFRFLLSGCALLTLAGCLQTDFLDTHMERRGDAPVKSGSAEELLAAEGAWNIVEEDTANVDPSSLHRLAKKRVDPNSMKTKSYMPQSKIAMAEQTDAGKDVNYRLLRVERNMASLRDDFRRLLPPLSNLIVADRELDGAIQSIQARDAASASGHSRSVSGTPKPLKVAGMSAARPVKAMRHRAPHSAQKALVEKQAYSPVVSDGTRRVKSLRLGEHPGKTRIVLDITGPAQFRSDVDNNEKLLIVELPGTSWSAQVSKALKHPLIAGYTAQPSPSGGTMLAIEMKKPVKVTGGSSLPPNPTYNNHRIFVDVAAL